MGLRPPRSLIPDMLSIILEIARAALESAEALLQWMLCETNKHLPPPALGICPGTALSLNSVVALSNVVFFIYSKKLFLACCCEVQRRAS